MPTAREIMTSSPTSIDIARAMPDAKVGDLVGDISAAPSNN